MSDILTGLYVKILDQVFSGLLAGRPQCQEAVFIADPSYGEGEYQCGVTMPAHELLAWSKAHIAATMLPWWDKIIWPFFQQWLSEADTDSKRASPLPKRLFQALQAETTDWVMNGKATVLCSSCRGCVSNISTEDIDRDRLGNRGYWWNSIWNCPAGHEIYRAKQEMRVFHGP